MTMYFPDVPFSYLYSLKFILWRDVLWALECGLISDEFVVGLANHHLELGDYHDLELDLALMNDSFDIRGCLNKLANVSGRGYPASDSKSKWLFIALKWLFEKKSEIEDPLGKVELIYEDFDFPVEIESFVRYMPPSDGYQPQQHTLKENQNRLYENWAAYIEKTEVSLDER
ncbi:DUF2247 family protein [Pseudomonas nitroreducens]|uniref:DUF2247 family protein n=1 Tax=Pseudomonas TaxID=286 RepID=UPI00036CB8C8|nr:DUF2247 family protein [Pseudomonas nitroreducens]